MIEYKVGQVIADFINRQECTLFDITDEGANLIVLFRDPTEEEIEQFKDRQFEIRFTEIDNIIMMTFKIGNLNWMDAPYSPHLSKNLTKFISPNGNQGLGVTLFLIDAITGEIKAMRLIGLTNDFTNKFIGTVTENKMREFNTMKYNSSLNKIFSTYSTDEIVNMSNVSCKID